MCCKAARQVKGTGYWGSQTRGLQGVPYMVQEIECNDIPPDSIEVVQGMEKKKIKKSLMKKRILEMKNNAQLE